MPCYRIPGAGHHAIIGPCDWGEYFRSPGSTISPHHPDQIRPQVHRIGMAAVNTRVKGLTLNLYGLPQDKLARVEIP
jgi:hypothetical protein